MRGIESVGDSTGTLLTSPPDILRHMLENFVYGDWQQGAWLATPTFPDDTTLNQIDTASFDTAETNLNNRIVGGYPLAISIGSDGAFLSVRDFIATMSICGDMDVGFNRKSQVMLSVFTESALTGVGTYDEIRDIHEGSFDVEDFPDEMYNIVPYAYRYNYAAGKYDVEGEVRSQESIDGYSEESVMPKLELRYVRDGTAAEDNARKHLRRVKDPPRRVTFKTNRQGLTDELGDLKRITHPEGVGASGWSKNPIRIIRHETDPLDYSVTIQGTDVKRLFRTKFILGDRTALPAAWTSASDDQRYYGYLGNRTTDQFADGEPIKRL